MCFAPGSRISLSFPRYSPRLFLFAFFLSASVFCVAHKEFFCSCLGFRSVFRKYQAIALPTDPPCCLQARQRADFYFISLLANPPIRCLCSFSFLPEMSIIREWKIYARQPWGKSNPSPARIHLQLPEIYLCGSSCVRMPPL